MIDKQENRDLLSGYARSYDIELSNQQASLLLQHLDLLVEANKTTNLTRITEPKDAIIRHIVDSLLLLPSATQYVKSDDARFLDMGTGGGFPGIPLAIMTPWSGLLVDSVGKKVRLVDEFLGALRIAPRVEAKACRVEDLAREVPQSFDLVTARAVAELGVLLEYAAPLLKRQGVAVIAKALVQAEEFEAGQKTADIVGLELVSRETYELSDGEGHREVLTYRKVRKSRVRLPRATGMAKHKPLAGNQR